MEFSTIFDHERAEFLIEVTGKMTLDDGKKLLRAVWADKDYLASDIVIYDVGALEALPDMNGMLALSYFVVSNRVDGGPNMIALASPEFKLDATKKALAGFARVIGLNINYFADVSAARDWASS